MTITPFLTLRLGSKKDVLRARQTARRIAHLLGYPPQEQTCIAAGVFVVACQAVELFGRASLCFQIENQQLRVFVEPPKSKEPLMGNRLLGVLHEESPSLYQLTKPLPRDQQVEELDLGWLVAKVEEAACSSLFDEIVRQNQEMLSLLHQLRLCQGSAIEKEGKFPGPHAA